MAYKSEVLLDSISPAGTRLTTMVVTYPRFVHSELMTHRMFSRNAASSRAIPIEKMIEAVLTDPAMPIHWGRNQAGMQAHDELRGEELEMAKQTWLAARDRAVEEARDLARVGAHKQIANRLLEPFAWITVIITATEWRNFFKLRCHSAAQPELRHIAELMRNGMQSSRPIERLTHLPYLTPLDKCDRMEAFDISAARCARVSYLNHEGERDVQKDLALAARLQRDGHWSPFEHAAEAGRRPGTFFANFYEWVSHRHLLERALP